MGCLGSRFQTEDDDKMALFRFFFLVWPQTWYNITANVFIIILSHVMSKKGQVCTTAGAFIICPFHMARSWRWLLWLRWRLCVSVVWCCWMTVTVQVRGGAVVVVHFIKLSTQVLQQADQVRWNGASFGWLEAACRKDVDQYRSIKGIF